MTVGEAANDHLKKRDRVAKGRNKPTSCGEGPSRRHGIFRFIQVTAS